MCNSFACKSEGKKEKYIVSIVWDMLNSYNYGLLGGNSCWNRALIEGNPPLRRRTLFRFENPESIYAISAWSQTQSRKMLNHDFLNECAD